MSKSRIIIIIAVVLLAAVCMSPGIGSAVPEGKDTITITANTSTGGSQPALNTSGNSWVYAYERSCNSSFSDTLNVDFTIAPTSATNGQSYNIGLLENPDEAELVSSIGLTTIPSPPSSPITFSVSDNNVAVPEAILVQSTAPLAPGDYQLKLAISYASSNLQSSQNPAVNFIQVNVHVNECAASAPTCFFTDSNGDFLVDCEGAVVSTSSGGTFMLVNKKNGTIVATNPGQFYYNYIWTNDGEAIDAQVQLGGLLNLAPKGANSVHAYTFDTSGFTQDVAAFNMVNNDGTPCGPFGPCTINVGEGETLWVTWHLAYAGIGSSKPEAGNSCPGNEEIGAAARLVDANNTTTLVADACSTVATGYNKR